MSEHKEPLLLEHDADGIRELDNLLPRWWLWLFHLSIIFSVGYMVYYHVTRTGDLQIAEYQKELAAAPATVSASELAGGADAAPSQDAAILAQGKEIFMANCLPCHAPDGGGLVGPNFCDNYFIHGPAFADSIRIIESGVPAKGMISWKATLKPDQIEAVASYIYTLRGTTPANPKAPEGEKFEG